MGDMNKIWISTKKLIRLELIMKKIIVNILKVMGIYIGYLVLTIIAFYITGMYIWTTPPTKLVLIRMLVFPIFLTLATTTFILVIKKFKR